MTLDEFYEAVWAARNAWLKANVRPRALRVPRALWERMQADARDRVSNAPVNPLTPTAFGIPVEPVSELRYPELVTHEYAQDDPNVPGETVVFRRLRISFPS